MNYISMLVYYIFLSPVLTSKIIPKFCINCKFYKKNIFTSSEFGKCTLFPVEIYDDSYLVNGKVKNDLAHYHYCSTSRSIDRMCGKEGKFYEEKNK